MELDDFGGSPCTSNDDCANAEAQLRPSPPACGQAVCEEGLCKWQEAKEICNGMDDDCDDLIDEGLVFSGQASSALPAVPAIVAYASVSEPEQTFVAVAHDGWSEGSTLVPDAKTVGELRCDSLSNPICNFAEVALAADEHHDLVVASINTLGCAAGQLQVGLSDKDTPFNVWLGKAQGEKSEAPSNIAPGVDVVGKGCTGASRSGNLIGSGATRPAIASLGTQADGEGALLLWLAASAEPKTPHAASIPVEALGLVVPAVSPEWLNGANQGKPLPLGQTTSLSTPAVLAVWLRPGVGKYLVAFPAAQDSRLGVRLLIVPSDRAGPRVEDAEGTFIEGGPADRVSLALGNTQGAEPEVGLAWVAGDESEAQLRFTIVSPSTLARIADWDLSIPAFDPRFAPQILHRDTGFAKVGPSGGWFLSWVETENEQSRTLQVARLRDSTLELLNHTPLHSGVVAQPLLYPSSSDDVARVGYALIDPSARTEPETFVDWCH